MTSTRPRWILPVTLLVSMATVVLVSFWPIGEPPRGTSTQEDNRAIQESDSLIVEPPRPAPDGMVWVQGGRFEMGTNELFPPGQPNPQRIKADEFPQHTVELDGFWIDTTEVTNQQFSEFVAMTGYLTFAEKVPTREELARSGLDVSHFKDEHLVAGSLCFNPNFNRQTLDTLVDGWEYQVWKFVPGANWRHPEGPESSITDRMHHPVVHVSWEDAVAFLEWSGQRLPTEAEFEYAARNAGHSTRFPWGNELTPGGEMMCNYYQGTFPFDNLVEDGFPGPSPVRSFPPNSLGIYDISGNLWEWCHDYYDANYYSNSPRRNPQGPNRSFDPQEPSLIKRVMRGGSFLCNTNSCTGYRCEARMKGEFNSGAFHTGFRGVVDPRGLPLWQARQSKILEWRTSQN